MSLSRYRFTNVWLVEGEPHHAFEVLRELADYPLWWPEVKEVWQRDDSTIDVRCRAMLPYDLRFRMQRRHEDRDSGVLEVAMTGDLEGFSRWTISAAGRGCRLVFEEDVTLNKELLNRIAPVARGVFKLNHALMMRHGKRGLRTYLAGFRRGRAQSHVG
jgi:hypothetical protein